MIGDKCVGAVVCKLDLHKKVVRRGYIAMLAVDENYRKEKIGINMSNFVSKKFKSSNNLQPRFQLSNESYYSHGGRRSR